MKHRIRSTLPDDAGDIVYFYVIILPLSPSPLISLTISISLSPTISFSIYSLIQSAPNG